MPETLNFSKHKAQPPSDVSIDYLASVATKFNRPPRSVVLALKRRAAMHGTRDAIEAIAAVTALEYRQARRKKRRKPRPWLAKARAARRR